MGKFDELMSGKRTPHPTEADTAEAEPRKDPLMDQSAEKSGDADDPSKARRGPREVPSSTVISAAITVAAGIVAVVIAQFLPMFESLEFFRVAENTLIQNGAGWGFIAAASVATGAVLFGRGSEQAGWTMLIAGIVIVAGAAYYAFSEDARTLTSLFPAVGFSLDSVPREEVAAPGIGMYLSAVGGIFISIGSIASLWRPGTETTTE